MGRNVKGIIAGLSADRRRKVNARYRELKLEVEGLRALREIAGKAQAEIASALSIKQPSVSKIERQADMYLSTLRSYVEAVGGKLELIVELPARRKLRLQALGDGTPPVVAKEATSARRRAKSRRRLKAAA